jgi:hypothetical protein
LQNVDDIIAMLRAGQTPKPGPQYVCLLVAQAKASLQVKEIAAARSGRNAAEPFGGRLTLLKEPVGPGYGLRTDGKL